AVTSAAAGVAGRCSVPVCSVVAALMMSGPSTALTSVVRRSRLYAQVVSLRCPRSHSATTRHLPDVTSVHAAGAGVDAAAIIHATSESVQLHGKFHGSWPDADPA